MYSGAQTLLEEVGLTIQDIETIILAGGVRQLCVILKRQ